MNLENILRELEELSISNVFSITKVEWWLLKYNESFQKVHDYIYSKYLYEMEDGSIVRLPPCLKPTDNDKFLNLYTNLEDISLLHRNEKYFEQELITFKRISNSKRDVKTWIKKNEHLGADKYVCFLLDYLDYSENVKNLKLYINSIEELEMYIDREEFKNTIEFLEIFNELYWDQEILPG